MPHRDSVTPNLLGGCVPPSSHGGSVSAIHSVSSSVASGVQNGPLMHGNTLSQRVLLLTMHTTQQPGTLLNLHLSLSPSQDTHDHKYISDEFESQILDGYYCRCVPVDRFDFEDTEPVQPGGNGVSLYISPLAFFLFLITQGHDIDEVSPDEDNRAVKSFIRDSWHMGEFDQLLQCFYSPHPIECQGHDAPSITIGKW